MRWADGYIAVDWGTTNRRAYRVESDGRCSQEFEDDRGVLSIASGGFEAAVAQITQRLGDRPILLAGMIGSNRGWIEAPYAHCPAGLSDLAEQLVWAPGKAAAVVPGVAFLGERADVMRGEEVQILGAAAAGDIPADCLVCHPGTHNKWIELRGGRIYAFRTVMTGELFNLLRDRSILADMLKADVEPSPAFRDGVRRGLAGAPLTAELFETRARVLLGRSEAEDGGPFISGLLIGHDLRAGLEQRLRQPVVVMGRPELTELYSAALEEAGVESTQLDGERAFLAGARAIAELLE
jgi:2-dehydro-3-deoxygalactonokinase